MTWHDDRTPVWTHDGVQECILAKTGRGNYDKCNKPCAVMMAVCLPFQHRRHEAGFWFCTDRSQYRCAWMMMMLVPTRHAMLRAEK